MDNNDYTVQPQHQYHFFLATLALALAFRSQSAEFSSSCSCSSAQSSSCSAISITGLNFTCSALAFPPLACILESLASSWRLLKRRVSLALVCAERAARGLFLSPPQGMLTRCSLRVVGVMWQVSISRTASSMFSSLRAQTSCRSRSTLQCCLTDLQLAQRVTGKSAFLSQRARRLFLRSDEFLPSQEGKVGKPVLSAIFSAEYTQVIKPQEGMSPHSCSFRMVRSSRSPTTIPSTPSTRLLSYSRPNTFFLFAVSRFSCTIRGTRSLSTKKHSTRSGMRMDWNSERLRSLRAASKWLIMTAESLACLLRLLSASMVILLETVRKMTSRQLSIWRMSFWKVSTRCSSARSSPEPPSLARISLRRLASRALEGLWNLTGRQWLASERIFSLELSLQMQMMGTRLFFIIWMIEATPPLSPELIPSTSSIMISDFCRFLEESRLQEPLSSSATPLLLRTSLALNSLTMQLNSAARSRAVVVLPMPGSPLRRAALELMFPPPPQVLTSRTSRLLPLMCMSCQADSHSLRDFIWLFSPMTWSMWSGLNLSGHSLLSSFLGLGSTIYIYMGWSLLIGLGWWLVGGGSLWLYSYSLKNYSFGASFFIYTQCSSMDLLMKFVMGLGRTLLRSMWCCRLEPVFSMKKPSSLSWGMMVMPLSRAYLLLVVSAMAVGYLLLKLFIIKDPCIRMLHFFDKDFGHSAPSCMQTQIISSLSQSQQ